jgi:hypothetical protein
MSRRARKWAAFERAVDNLIRVVHSYKPQPVANTRIKWLLEADAAITEARELLRQAAVQVAQQEEKSQ